jgi:MoaA/NifB/PqqE/SkfB family radical SAM enzyme
MADYKIDSHKLWWHSERVEEWLNNTDCGPIYLEIGLTNICNHDCTFCGFDYAQGTNTLPSKVILENLKPMKECGVKSICYSGAGEPCLHKDFPEIISQTNAAGIDAAFSTNAALFDKDKAEKVLPYASWVRFSVDAATPETHAKIHRPKRASPESDFEIVIKNISNAVEIKQKNTYPVTLGAQFILLEENKHELLPFAEMCRKIGVDLLQIKPYSRHPPSIKKLNVDYNNCQLLEDNVLKYATPDFKVVFRSSRMQRISSQRNYSHCLALPFWAMINERGDVMPCDIYYDQPSHSYGNIKESNFYDIWHSERRRQIMDSIFEKGTSGCKEGCRMDAINIDLWKLKKRELSLKDILQKGSPPANVNFI